MKKQKRKLAPKTKNISKIQAKLIELEGLKSIVESELGSMKDYLSAKDESGLQMYKMVSRKKRRVLNEISEEIQKVKTSLS